MDERVMAAHERRIREGDQLRRLAAGSVHEAAGPVSS